MGKNMKSHRLRFAAVLTGFALLFAGCSNSGTDSGDSQSDNADVIYSDTLEYPLSATIPSLDPHISTSGAAAMVGHEIWETLVAFDANYQIQPELASSWEFSDDARTLTFTIREGVKFHDGSTLTPEDVTASLNRWKSKAARVSGVLGDAEFEVAGDNAVSITTPEPHTDLLAQLANTLQFSAIMPARVINEAGADGVTEFIGTGPYSFVSYETDQQVELTRFDDYQPVDSAASGLSGAKSAPTQNLVFTIVTDSSTRLASYLSGDSNFVDLTADTVTQVTALDDTTVSKQLAFENVIVFNKRSEVFRDVRVRQAVAKAIDPDAYLLAVVGDSELYRLNPGYLFEENSLWWSDAGSDGIYGAQDLDGARQLLAEAGYDSNTSVRTLTSHDYGGGYYSSAVILQSQLAQVGINLELDVSDYATLLTKRADETAWDLYTGPFVVPSTLTQALYLGATYGWPDDAELTELLSNASAAQTDEETREAASAIQEHVWETLPVIKVGDQYSYQAVRNTVSDFSVFDGVPVLWNVKAAE
ncbi:ABC transporter substrate-binding protein [Brooklawnia cerclae]